MRPDVSGHTYAPAMADAPLLARVLVVSDGVAAGTGALRALSDGFAGLVVTTGGTGFGPRDLTPEGTRAVIEREAPGVVEAIRRASDEGGRGFGMLSRAVAGTRGQALLCNLPGSSGGAIEGLEILLPIA